MFVKCGEIKKDILQLSTEALNCFAKKVENGKQKKYVSYKMEKDLSQRHKWRKSGGLYIFIRMGKVNRHL